ncbi:MAG: PAS domain-containing protein [Deferrisomatales bacterium]
MDSITPPEDPATAALREALARAEATLRAAEGQCALYRRAVESIQDGLSILDRDLTVVLVNPTMERWYRGPGRLVGRKCYEAYHGRAAPCEPCPSLRTLVSGEPAFDVVSVGGSRGEEGWLELFTFPSLDPHTGQVAGVIEYVRDVTERRRAELALERARDDLERRVADRTAELAEANRRLTAEIEERRLAQAALADSERLHRTLLGSISDAVLLADDAGRLSYVSPSAGDVLGLTGERVRALEAADQVFGFGLFDPAELAARGELANLERPVTGDDGRERALLVSVKRVSIRGGTVLYTCRDVSDRQRMEDELRRTRDSAEVANRAKSQFLANMSHELRTPLNSILGYSQVVLDGLEGPLTPDQRDSLTRVERSARLLLHLVNEILDLSKIEAGRVETESLVFDPRSCVEELIAECAPWAQDKGLALSAAVAPAVPGLVVGDPERLRQVLVNLVENAIKFTPAGAVSVEVGVDSRDEAGVTLGFAVHDTGVGIAPELHGVVFEAFTQADESATRAYAGAGLGLAICQRLVPLLGGRIGVESTPGQGSRFSFTARFGV